MTIEVPQNKEISEGKNGGRKRVGSAIGRGRANGGGGVHIKKREQGEVVKRDVDPYIIRTGIKRKKRGGRKFREDRPCLTKRQRRR